MEKVTAFKSNATGMLFETEKACRMDEISTELQDNIDKLSKNGDSIADEIDIRSTEDLLILVKLGELATKLIG